MYVKLYVSVLRIEGEINDLCVGVGLISMWCIEQKIKDLPVGVVVRCPGVQNVTPTGIFV